jgi:hypothetical protein
MGDNDIQGQFDELMQILLSPPWREIWDSLGLSVETFETMGLAREAPDVVVWQTCQSRQVLLVTGNRNNEGPDSLEAAIRHFNEASSLPVVTLANSRKFAKGRSYAERVVVRLLEYLLDIDDHRGTGRLWVP